VGRIACLVLMAILALAQPAAATEGGARHHDRGLGVRVTHIRVLTWLPGLGHARPGHRFIAVRVAYHGVASAFASDWWMYQPSGDPPEVHTTGLAALPRSAKVRPGVPVRGWLVWDACAEVPTYLIFIRPSLLRWAIRIAPSDPDAPTLCGEEMGVATRATVAPIRRGVPVVGVARRD
jgi:hypothetical protein